MQLSLLGPSPLQLAAESPQNAVIPEPKESDPQTQAAAQESIRDALTPERPCSSEPTLEGPSQKDQTRGDSAWLK